METARVRSLAREILALPDAERQKVAREVLPTLLGTGADLEEIDDELRHLSDDDLHALLERACRRASYLAEGEILAIVAYSKTRSLKVLEIQHVAGSLVQIAGRVE